MGLRKIINVTSSFFSRALLSDQSKDDCNLVLFRACLPFWQVLDALPTSPPRRMGWFHSFCECSCLWWIFPWLKRAPRPKLGSIARWVPLIVILKHGDKRPVSWPKLELVRKAILISIPLGGWQRPPVKIYHTPTASSVKTFLFFPHAYWCSQKHFTINLHLA